MHHDTIERENDAACASQIVKPKPSKGTHDDAGEHWPLEEVLVFCALLVIWVALLLGAGAELILTGHLFW